MCIRDRMPADKTRWLELWSEYLVFYGVQLPDSQTELTWSRLMDSSEIFGLGAYRDGMLVGFCHYSFTYSTWSETRDLYLEDLYVEKSQRRAGIATQLITMLDHIAKTGESSRIWWHTMESNSTARALYDKIAVKTGFIKYERNVH